MFVRSTMFWGIFTKCCYHYKHPKYSAQKPKMVVKLNICGVIFASHLKASVQSKWHRRCRSVSPTFLLKFLPHILGYNFCVEHHVFGTFLPNENASKHPKLLAQKLVCLVTKYVGEINRNWWQKLIPD